jgi:tetratricopeptide (TPR) repeat protein
MRIGRIVLIVCGIGGLVSGVLAQENAPPTAATSNDISALLPWGLVLLTLAGMVWLYRHFDAQNKHLQQQIRQLQASLLNTQAIKAQSASIIPDTDALDEDEYTRLNAEITRLQTETATIPQALALLALGERQYQMRDLDGALSTYKRALKLNAQSPAIHYHIGYIHAQRGALDLAEASLTAALEHDPDFSPAQAARGFVHWRHAETLPEGETRETIFTNAEKKLLDALYNAPKLLDDDGDSWWATLGGVYASMGQPQKALEAYQKAAQITPYAAYPLSMVALYQGLTGDTARMLQSFRDTERLARLQTQSRPDDYKAYAHLMIARLAHGKIQEAEEALGMLLPLLPENQVYVVPSLLAFLEQLKSLLPEQQSHITQVMHYISGATPNAPFDRSAVALQNDHFVIRFPDALPSLAVRASNDDDPNAISELLDLRDPRPAILILGGSVDMDAEDSQNLRHTLEQGLAHYAQANDLAIIDGGTDAGVMQLVGNIRADKSFTFPLVGVAPINLVRYPGYDNPDGYDLNSGHSHFIFTDEGDWGDETDMMVQFTQCLSSERGLHAVAIIINGGKIVRQETYRLTLTERLKMPVVVLQGSGRFADTLAEAIQSGQTDDSELQEIITHGDVHLANAADGPDALRQTLERFLKPPKS